MNKQLIHSRATVNNRFADFVKTLVATNPELPPGQLLVISRVVLVVLVFGFMGYFFDRMKQSVFTMESKAKTISRQL
jgi:hypothetical protein